MPTTIGIISCEELAARWRESSLSHGAAALGVSERTCRPRRHCEGKGPQRLASFRPGEAGGGRDLAPCTPRHGQAVGSGAKATYGPKPPRPANSGHSLRYLKRTS